MRVDQINEQSRAENFFLAISEVDLIIHRKLLIGRRGEAGAQGTSRARELNYDVWFDNLGFELRIFFFKLCKKTNASYGRKKRTLPAQFRDYF